MDAPLFAKLRQVCTVVEDFDATVRALVEQWGIGPFKCWHFRPPRLFDTTLQGKPAPFEMKLAITWLGDTQWEVIQPVAGDTLYQRSLTSRGRAVQHLLMDTGQVSFEDAADRLAARGHPFGQTARVSIPARIGPLRLPPARGKLAAPIGLHFGYVGALGTLRTDIELTRYPLGLPERLVLRWGRAQWCVPARDHAFESALPNREVRRVVKVGIVTRDLEGTARAWLDVAGVGPWRVFERPRERLAHVSAAGAPAAFDARVAWAMLDRVLVELVQPLDGQGPVHDALATCGEGVAWVGVQPDGEPLERVVARSVARGTAVTMRGALVGTTPAVRLATRAAIGTDLELLDADGPALAAELARTPPDRVIER